MRSLLPRGQGGHYTEKNGLGRTRRAMRSTAWRGVRDRCTRGLWRCRRRCAAGWSGWSLVG
jgi:hypothetical protein